MAGLVTPPLGRRRFLQLVAGGADLTLPAGNWATTASGIHRVGVGRETDAYAATLRAVEASQDWAGLDLLGRTGVIKPNLATPRARSRSSMRVHCRARSTRYPAA